MLGAVAVGQGQGTQQFPHAVRPPALDGIPLGEQVGDRPFPPDEHGALPQQAGFIHIPVALEAGAGEIGIPEEGERLQHSADRWGARQGGKGGGIQGQPTTSRQCPGWRKAAATA